MIVITTNLITVRISDVLFEWFRQISVRINENNFINNFNGLQSEPAPQLKDVKVENYFFLKNNLLCIVI